MKELTNKFLSATVTKGFIFKNHCSNFNIQFVQSTATVCYFLTTHYYPSLSANLFFGWLCLFKTYIVLIDINYLSMINFTSF